MIGILNVYLEASSVVFGDPSKIIERESTYAASFRWTDEHTLRASNTNPYDVPLKTRGLCPPQHTVKEKMLVIIGLVAKVTVAVIFFIIVGSK